MVNYSPTVLRNYASILYGLSIANAILMAGVFAVLGAAGGALLSGGSDDAMGGGAVLGGIVGAFVGWIASFLLRVSAQLVLCFVEMEAHLKTGHHVVAPGAYGREQLRAGVDAGFSADSPSVCSRCGTSILSSDPFCGNCGASLNS